MDEQATHHSEAITRYLLEATRNGLAPLTTALESVPDDRLGEQPVPEQYPVGVMIEHVFGAVAFTARSIRLGSCEKEDMADLTKEDEATGTRPRIQQMRDVATREIDQALAGLSPEAASQSIRFWFGQTMSVPETATLGFQELCHHRGQVQSFLRLMGLEPPDIYESAGASGEDDA